jgi:hypothetical protein
MYEKFNVTNIKMEYITHKYYDILILCVQCSQNAILNAEKYAVSRISKNKFPHLIFLRLST